ncbi:MAG: AAA family ATPase, partial [Raineya sp.]|nr:AAA family ATPase [Raineya sp.]
GIDTRTAKSTEEGFTLAVQSAVEYFMDVYDVFSQEERQKILSFNSAANTIKQFLQQYKKETRFPIYLLIDEYDHFTNEILWRSLSEFKTSVSQDGYVRKFYENIKIATQAGTVSRFFITGVSPITLDSLTSGFNIVTHLTHNYYFHEMVGFTEQEVRELLALSLDDQTQQEAIMQDIRAWYNGYK